MVRLFHKTSALKQFIAHESASGILLIGTAILALLCANINFTQSIYATATQPGVILFVNDVLMALFFLVVGTELKREIIAGALSSRARLIQPLCAAAGGMIVPSLIFLLINYNAPDYWRGWAIPAATDIAFALGLLSLLGTRIPKHIKVALMAVAILDDLGAIIIIALFYTAQLHLIYIALACVGAGFLYALNKNNVMKVVPYILAGVIVWIGFFKGGVHPTLAGVLTALALPMRNQHGELQADAPLYRVEHNVHPYVAFFILPIFAFVNAGLSLSGLQLGMFTQSLTAGVMIGLLVGKPLGIMAGLGLAHVTHLARKSPHESWVAYIVMALLCGIGFTMALFIGGLAFADEMSLDKVKLGIIAGSFLAACAGMGLAIFVLPKRDIKLT
jgi:NhaA family Na+:H+ antiporter